MKNHLCMNGSQHFMKKLSACKGTATCTMSEFAQALQRHQQQKKQMTTIQLALDGNGEIMPKPEVTPKPEVISKPVVPKVTPQPVVTPKPEVPKPPENTQQSAKRRLQATAKRSAAKAASSASSTSPPLLPTR